MTKVPEHIPMPPRGFTVEDHALMVADRAVRDVVEEAGGTPAYIYSKDAIDLRVAELRAALPPAVRLHYAVKANPMPAVIRHLATKVDGLDVASAGELALALEAGMPPAQISFAGPGKTDAELTAAAQAGITVNLESAGEMRRLAAIGERLGRRPAVAIRVNPAFELRRSGMHMGGGPKPFGVDEEQVPAMAAELAGLRLDFVGLHIFAGSQMLDTDALIETQKATLETARRLAADISLPVRSVNLGGGLGIPYFPGDRPLDLARVGTALEAGLAETRRDLPDTEFALELGRFLVGEAGIYVTRIVDRKVSRGRTYLVTDGGMHHHLALSGNFGQVLRKNYPVALADKADRPGEETVDVVGCLCTPLDRLGDAVLLPHAEVGDLVVIYQSGAYGASASPQQFLGHPAPRELLI